jgi:hypothetical protein
VAASGIFGSEKTGAQGLDDSDLLRRLSSSTGDHGPICFAERTARKPRANMRFLLP